VVGPDRRIRRRHYLTSDGDVYRETDEDGRLEVYARACGRWVPAQDKLEPSEQEWLHMQVITEDEAFTLIASG
jgi:hypothetical protein